MILRKSLFFALFLGCSVYILPTVYSQSNEKIILPFYPFDHPLTREADSLFLKENNKDASALYKQANNRFRDTGDWEGIAYTNNMIAELYVNRFYNFSEAEKILEKNIALIDSYFSENHPLLSDAYLTYGSLLDLQGHAERSLELLHRSLKINQEYYGTNSIQVAEVYYRIAQNYHYTKAVYDTARENYNRSLIINEQILPEKHPDLIKIYFSLASIYRHSRDFQRANINIDHALHLYRKDSLNYVRKIALSELLKANILNDMKNYSTARTYYERAIDQFRSLGDEYNYNLIIGYLNLGVAYLRNNDLEPARININKSYDVYSIYFSEDNPGDILPDILKFKGWYFTKTEKMDSARYYLFKALDISKKNFNSDLQQVSNIHELIADMFLGKNQFDSAMFYTQKALITLIPDFDNMKSDSNPDIEFNESLPRLVNILALKSNIYFKKYEEEEKDQELLSKALKIYLKIDSLSDGIRNSDLSEGSKLIIASDIHGIFEDALECVVTIYRLTGATVYLDMALRFFEKNKYMLLNRNLELASKSNELKIPLEIRHKEDSLKTLFAEITRKIESSDPNENVDELTALRFKVDNALNDIQERKKEMFPNYYEAELDGLIIEFNDLKDYAENSEDLLIGYYMGDSNIYILGVSQVGVSLDQVTRTAHLNAEIEKFLGSISKGTLNVENQENFKNFCQSSNYLFDQLIFPVLESHKTGINNTVVISPDGMLAQVPFEALIRNKPTQEFPDYKKLPYLISEYDIGYTYSFNLFFKEKNELNEKQNKILAFSYSNIEVLKNPERRSRDVFELPGTGKEIESIKKIIKGEHLFLTDEKATETQFKTRCSDFEILHLAVHGIGDYESAIDSRLIFKNKEDSLNDGNLFIYELYNLDLRETRLAILSACETGIGKEIRGEGVFSIARGFASAGCPSIIMSLWKVDDMVSADIMAGFYKNLTKGAPINTSLRESKLEYIKNADQFQAHPGNWAAFVPLGKMDRIYEKKFSPVIMGAAIIIVMIIIAALYIRFFRRSSSS